MNRDFLTRLYWESSDERSPDNKEKRLCEVYERLEKVRDADSLFNETLYETALTSGEKDQLEQLAADMAVCFEQQGFINGFRFSMKLAAELSGEQGLS
jgi:hypothetical protein